MFLLLIRRLSRKRRIDDIIRAARKIEAKIRAGEERG